MDNLVEELDELKSIVNFPRLFLANHFSDLRTKVDKIFSLRNEDDSNDLWLEMIERINEFERDCLSYVRENFTLNKDIIDEIKENIYTIHLDIESVKHFDEFTLEKSEWYDAYFKRIKSLIHREMTRIKRIAFSNRCIDVIEHKNTVKLITIYDYYFSKEIFEMIRFYTKKFHNSESGLILESEFVKKVILFKKWLEMIDEDFICVCISETTELTFKNLNLLRIEEDAFSDLIGLEQLNILNCDLEYIKPNTFQDLENLLVLNLSNNKLKSFDSNLISNLIMLKELDLSNNPIEIFNFEALNELAKLKKLNLSQIGLKSIDCKMFKGLFSLEELILSSNEIIDLGDDTFQSLSNLKVLNLDNNKLSEIHSHLLERLKNLKTLSLSNNKITWFHSNLFNSSIEVLNLSYNKIVKFDFGVLKRLVNLKILSLDGLGITELTSDCLNHLVKLKVLSLDENDFKIVDENVFSSLKKLKELSLGNKIETFYENCFCDLTSLRFLNLSCNLTSKTFDFEILKKKKNLVKLKLNNCGIKSIPDDFFKRMTKLTDLDLSSNEINEINSNTFNGLINLQLLNLTRNNIREIESDSFKALVNLSKLYLDENICKLLKINELVKLPKLCYLLLKKIGYHNNDKNFDDFMSEITRTHLKIIFI